ncbi:MAG: GPW/gp25 family protein [Oscillospiraceae bacterium]
MNEARTDWKYPIEYSGGKVQMNSLEQDIRQSLFLLLNTRRGERVMRPNYGCNLSQFAFESVNYSLLTRIQSEVLGAIKLYEPRVDNVTVTVDNSSKSELSAETLIINIGYTIRENAMQQTLSFRLADTF